MASSFINEHSAEFILVPQFGKILRQRCEIIIPIFFWSSREGSNRALESLQGKFVNVVALYPRRPKVEKINQPFIQVKLNQSLFKNVDFLTGKGIPVFGGVPIANSLGGFYFGVDCAWFRLTQSGGEEILNLSMQNKLLNESQSAVKVDNKDILNVVRVECKSIQWENAIEYFREVRNNSDGTWRSFFGGNYKPVYFIMPVPSELV